MLYYFIILCNSKIKNRMNVREKSIEKSNNGFINIFKCELNKKFEN